MFDQKQADMLLRFGLLTEEELSQMLNVTTRTLTVWRSEGKGPASVRLGKNIFYRDQDIRTWIAMNVTYPHEGTEPDN